MASGSGQGSVNLAGVLALADSQPWAERPLLVMYCLAKAPHSQLGQGTSGSRVGQAEDSAALRPPVWLDTP